MAQQHSINTSDWHAHLYFDAHEAPHAQALCEDAGRIFAIPVARVHSAPIGPHPRGSCQLTVPNDRLGDIIGWLLLHRGPFTVLVHVNSGDDLNDHTKHAFWLGQAETLKLDIFRRQ
ncbi:MAG: 4,5-dioxygenase [Alphaproteobacteria bacterium]|nr:4,5-dioxygenase [Alphaproteobacteria bacterium]